ncbi:NAD(P)H-dependent oxidoreductase [Dasania sp. GY-MA-18]|uniref:NAD(P)H-dependent oxidoreductase n=1 Tax=Dasania phycosphaerae TaxID=2950436 RepID=A0A9J6RP18_9GAMM|nr:MULTISPECIES: NADPH-dependent FMN reductase [Dasania]MCR8923826.1 NAD(P)H-dependent oxidoreductase [Dasania sp. GY-MA-18]MCZ0866260.1 NAD(P)H-dependent oxidoreductase [Dasania phycosphaerae]MCZ0869984.1 NAD(P)H-dependent oxidoreductase [Dasania phycosphaerae]
MKFIFLSGSFHSNSRSLAILKNIAGLFGEHETEIVKLDQLPFYSEDLNKERPEIIRDFLAKIAQADGIVCCTPEYNHSIPAVLKNAIDWASRPAFNSALKDMPISIITQAVSPVGGARAQAHLKLVFDSTLSKIQACHEMMITQVDQIFDEAMTISDPKIMARLDRHVSDFINMVERVR